MPRKTKVTKADILETAVQLVRQDGSVALNARNLAKKLNCSTQPNYSNFNSMDEVRVEVIRQAEALYDQYIRDDMGSGKYPPYKASGMAYIRFAVEERELFKLLFMRDRSKEVLPGITPDIEVLMEIIQKNVGISREKAERFHLSMWSHVHGIATMAATSYLQLDWELISLMLTEVYQGLRLYYIKED